MNNKNVFLSVTFKILVLNMISINLIIVSVHD